MEMEHKDFGLEIEKNAITEQGTFKGFASTFGGKPDAYGDIIVQGAFLGTLSRGGANKNGVVMLKHHDRKLIPGIWTLLQENKKGLITNGSLLLETQLGKETHVEMKAGAIKGLSIGFRTLIDKWVHTANKPSIRYIKEVELFEISIVAFPANTRATITSVKSAIEAATTEREMEKALREVGQLSSNAAKYIVSLIDMGQREFDSEEKKPFPEVLDVFGESGWGEILKTINQVQLEMQISRELRT